MDPAILLPLTVLAAMMLVMTSSWLTQLALGNAGWTDVFWSFGTGAALSVAAFAPSGCVLWRQVMVAAMIAIWSTRLGSHIVRRVLAGPEDARYAISRRDWGARFQRNMLGLSLIQAPATALLSISVVQAAMAPGSAFRTADATGLAIFGLAIAGETLADHQLRRFRADPANRGRICDVGLWAWSRHPNYVFEAALWWAWPAMELDLASPWTWTSLAAPLTMFVLLRYVSGVPPLESVMASSRGEAWRTYARRVSPFFFRPPRDVAA